MRIAVVGCVLLCGCRSVPPVTRPAASAETMFVAPTIPRADFDVVPAELGDAGVLQRIKHRVRLRQIGAAWVREQGEALARSHGGVAASVLPVLGETAHKIRVVSDDDDARLALWVDRGDAMLTVLAPVELADEVGHTAPTAGVWIEPGIALDAPRGAGPWREVHVQDEQLAVDGWLPHSLIGHVWVATARQPAVTKLAKSTVWTPPRDPRPLVKLAKGAVIRAETDARSRVVATTIADDVIGAVVARRGAWTEVELFRPQLRVRGVVATASVLATTDDLSTHGSGSGHGFGMSHADRIEVSAGACLFDAVDGEVVGVQLAPSTRYGSLRRRDADGWSLVFVDSPWALLELYVHDTGADPDHPSWELCTKPSGP